jgi:hypothetical protein
MEFQTNTDNPLLITMKFIVGKLDNVDNYACEIDTYAKLLVQCYKAHCTKESEQLLVQAVEIIVNCLNTSNIKHSACSIKVCTEAILSLNKLITM